MANGHGERGVATRGSPGSGSPETFTLQGPDGSEADIHELRVGFRQGFVLELIDLTSETPIEVLVFALNPRSYTLSEPFQLTLTPAEDDSVVAEENGIIVREITLEGTFGLTKKRASGFLGAQGNGAAISGTEHFNAMRNMFRRYSSLKKDPNRAADIQLIFHSLRDDDHFVVAPRSFETPRDARTSRAHYAYRVQLAAIAPAEESQLRRRPSTAGFDFTDALRTINEAFNDARGAFADVTKRLSEVKRKVGNIQVVMNNAAQLVNAVGGFLSGAADFIDFPLLAAASIAESLAGAADTLAVSIEDVTLGTATNTFSEDSRNLRRIEAAIDRISMFPSKFEGIGDGIAEVFNGPRRYTVSDIENNAAGAQDSARTVATVGSGAQYGLDLDTGGGVERIRVGRTDTVDSIAAGAGTTPETIIVINDLRAPYISSGGGPGVARPGDTLLVPSGGAGAATEPGGEYLSPEDALYGVDFKIDDTVLRKEGRFELSVSNDLFDAELARGLANVVQGTQITILTEIGTTVFVPDVGIRRNVGLKGTIQHTLLASIVLREAILVDARISGIQSLRVVLDGDVLTQEITPIVGTSRRGVKLVLPFGRASGGSGE